MINIYNKDCMIALKEMEDNQFNLAIIDPPYGIGNFTKNLGEDRKRSDKKKYNKHHKKIDDWNNSIPQESYFKELKRVAKNHIIFGFQFYIRHLWDDLSGVIIHDFGSTGGYGSDADLAITNLQKRVTNFRYRWQGFIRENATETDKNRIHPCEKPVSLYEWLLMNYAKEGDKILDTHLGSGSIAIAAHNLGYDLEGYELDKEYFEAATKRFNNHKAQLRLYE